MALCHFRVTTRRKTVRVDTRGGQRIVVGGPSAAKVVRYLTREGEYAPDMEVAASRVAYLTRTSQATKDRGDLRHREVAHMPAWAQNDPTRFFTQAVVSERVNGRWATVIEAALPRELSHDEHLALTRDYVATVLAGKPVLWVKHEPKASDGGLQPHIHFLFSERTNDGIERTSTEYFRRWNGAAPELGGAKKDAFFSQRRAADRLRAAWADITNIHLERAGVEARVDPRSLDGQRSNPIGWWETRKEGYDASLPLESQVVDRMRRGTAGKAYERLSDAAAMQMEQEIHALSAHIEGVWQEERRLAQREHPETSLRPTEAARVEGLVRQGAALGITGERETIAEGAQVELDKGKGRDYGSGYGA